MLLHFRICVKLVSSFGLFFGLYALLNSDILYYIVGACQRFFEPHTTIIPEEACHLQVFQQSSSGSTVLNRARAEVIQSLRIRVAGPNPTSNINRAAVAVIATADNSGAQTPEALVSPVSNRNNRSPWNSQQSS